MGVVCVCVFVYLDECVVMSMALFMGVWLSTVCGYAYYSFLVCMCAHSLLNGLSQVWNLESRESKLHSEAKN